MYFLDKLANLDQIGVGGFKSQLLKDQHYSFCHPSTEKNDITCGVEKYLHPCINQKIFFSDFEWCSCCTKFF